MSDGMGFQGAVVEGAIVEDAGTARP